MVRNSGYIILVYKWIINSKRYIQRKLIREIVRR